MGSRAPLDHPLSYPGTRPAGPFLALGGHVVDVRLRPGAPVPDAVPEPGAGTGRTLRTALAALRSPAVSERRPVLAVGSNADPAQLAAKFAAAGCRDVVVGIPVRVGALQIRPSAHLSRRGYWPFAPVRLSADASDLVVCLLDDDQVAVLDATEPNYHRRTLDPSRHRIEVADGVAVPGLDRPALYVSRHGAVEDPRLPRWTDPPPSQATLLRTLLCCLPGPTAGLRTPAALVAAARRDPGIAERVTAAMPAALQVRPDGLSVLP